MNDYVQTPKIAQDRIQTTNRNMSNTGTSHSHKHSHTHTHCGASNMRLCERIGSNALSPFWLLTAYVLALEALHDLVGQIDDADGNVVFHGDGAPTRRSAAVGLAGAHNVCAWIESVSGVRKSPKVCPMSPAGWEIWMEVAEDARGSGSLGAGVAVCRRRRVVGPGVTDVWKHTETHTHTRTTDEESQRERERDHKKVTRCQTPVMPIICLCKDRQVPII